MHTFRICQKYESLVTRVSHQCFVFPPCLRIQMNRKMPHYMLSREFTPLHFFFEAIKVYYTAYQKHTLCIILSSIFHAWLWLLFLVLIEFANGQDSRPLMTINGCTTYKIFFQDMNASVKETFGCFGNCFLLYRIMWCTAQPFHPF